MSRRALKILHWSTFALLLWFVSIPQSDLRPALEGVHALMGLLLVATSGLWFARYLVRGPLARPGPKMERAAVRVQRGSHLALHLMLPALAWIGLIAVRPDLPGAALQPRVVGICFVAVALHALFNLWRHCVLRDNALAIMVPRALHFLL